MSISTKPIIQMSCLGKLGRFGNQLSEYAYARSYAERMGAVLQTPPWIGQKLFVGIDDPPITDPFPQLGLEEEPMGRVNINLFGYFFRKFEKEYTADQARKYFQIKPEILAQYPPRQEKYIAAHLRYGDMVRHQKKLWLVPQISFIRAMLLEGIDPEKVVWVSEEAGKPMMEDFITLMRADTLFISNSTFSFWAGVLGKNPTIYSPVLPKHRVGFTECDFEKKLLFVVKAKSK